MSELIADGVHKHFQCWDCGTDMLIISESKEVVKYCPYCNAELEDNYDIADNDIEVSFQEEVTVEDAYQDLPWDQRL
mgnify:CR=1 FL=1|tara:strand:- start:968 stop:1198 length:231 start_codon:yes stop_codon:yes gene_type:complete